MKNPQVKKTFLPACSSFSQGIEYPLHEVTREQVSTLESFATDKKKKAPRIAARRFGAENETRASRPRR